ncbi:MAG: VCBS repeat-containing protein, partial [Bacteroidota bacterium]
MKKILLLMQCLLVCGVLHTQVLFEDVGLAVGLRFGNSVSNIGNGISFVDFNQDGWDDLTIGTNAGKFIDFYLNDRGTYRRILPLVNHKDEAKQILWVDYDNDADLDLFVASYDGLNRLYQNQGELQMVDVTQAVGLPMNTEYTFGATWGDFDRDGWLDLYFGNHKDVTPDKYNKLFRSNGDGTFSDISQTSKAADLNKVPYCSAFLDFNNDLWPDIYTANDKLTYNTLLMNQGNGHFYDVSDLSQSGLKMNAMCVNVGDFNNDGWQDIYITNTPIGNRLLQNTGPGAFERIAVFEEVAEQAGVGYYGHGWASNFL